MIKIVEGNILNAKEDIICHQVNCQGVMGAGLAKQIKERFPECYEEYREFVKEYKLKQINLLGEVLLHIDQSTEKIIANLFGQDNFGTHKVQTNYKALKECFSSLEEEVNSPDSIFYGYSIAIPYKIGCGLGGGDWERVFEDIEEVFGDYDVTIYKFQE